MAPISHLIIINVNGLNIILNRKVLKSPIFGNSIVFSPEFSTLPKLRN